MKLLMVNPNTTAAMTQQVLQVSRGLVRNGVTVRGITAPFGSPVIATPESFAVGAQAVLAAWEPLAGWPDAIVLACFGDPGLADLQAAAGVPVAGMAQAALREAAAPGRPWRIVTAGAQWPAMLRANVAAECAGAQLDGIVALETTGLAISQQPEVFLARIQDALDTAAHDGMQAVVLGGAGFAGMRTRLRFDGTLIDGLEAALRQVGALPIATASRG